LENRPLEPTIAPAAPVASQSSDAPPDYGTQWTDANRSYCNSHTPLACSQYSDDSGECLNGALAASTILQIEREMLRQGEAPQQAARFAAEQAGYGDIAALALRAPDTMTPREFSNWVMKDCLEGIGQ
jgi:hypothetical protein